MIPWAYNCRLPLPRTVQGSFQLAVPTWKYSYTNFLIHLTIFTEPKYFKIKSMLTLIVYHLSSSIFKTTHHSLLLIKSLTPPVATPGHTHMPTLVPTLAFLHIVYSLGCHLTKLMKFLQLPFIITIILANSTKGTWAS